MQSVPGGGHKEENRQEVQGEGCGKPPQLFGEEPSHRPQQAQVQGDVLDQGGDGDKVGHIVHAAHEDDVELLENHPVERLQGAGEQQLEQQQHIPKKAAGVLQAQGFWVTGQARVQGVGLGGQQHKLAQAHHVANPPGQAHQKHAQEKQPNGDKELLPGEARLLGVVLPLAPALEQQGDEQHGQRHQQQGPHENGDAEQRPRKEVQPPPVLFPGEDEHGEKQHHGKAEEGFRQQALGVKGVNAVDRKKQRAKDAHAVLFRQPPPQEEGEEHRPRREKGLDKLDGVNALEVCSKHRHAQGEENGIPRRDIRVRGAAPIAVIALGQKPLGHGDVVALVGAVAL